MNEKLLSLLIDNGYQYRDKGNEIYLQYCPKCEHPDDGDFTHFSFNAETTAFRCKKCDYSGNMFTFSVDQGHILTTARRKIYKRPEEKKELTENDNIEKFYSWYEKERGIKKEILKSYKVGLHIKENERFIVYQFYNESGYLVNRKYRSCMDKKIQWQEKDAEPVYYGIDKIDFTDKNLVITEGEDDCHALSQMGVKNIVSVPHGATNYTQPMDSVNSKMDCLILVFDSDEIGQKGARLFAEKAGFHKCLNVLLPKKDPRECLNNGMTLSVFMEHVAKGKRFTIPEIVKAGELHNNYYTSPGSYIVNKKFNSFLGGLRDGEFTVITGHSGHGKTTCALNIAIWAANSNQPVLVMSFENSLKSIITKMVQINSGLSLWHEDEFLGEKKFIMTDSWINEQIDVLDNMPLYFLNPSTSDGYFDIPKIKKLCTYATKFYNVKLIIIDNLHYIIKISNHDNALHEIDNAIRTISNTAKELQTHIMLVAHPYKTENPQTGKLANLGLYCIKGSSTIVQEASNFIVVSAGTIEEKPISVWKMLKNREHPSGKKEIIFDVAENFNTLS